MSRVLLASLFVALSFAQDEGCEWTACAVFGCPRGTIETQRLSCGLVTSKRRCCSPARRAEERWAAGAAAAERGKEDACFNRCPPETTTCNERTLLCDCRDGFVRRGSRCDPRADSAAQSAQGSRLALAEGRRLGSSASSAQERRRAWLGRAIVCIGLVQAMGVAAVLYSRRRAPKDAATAAHAE
mmetsp:Transcript_26600/g.87202  ORF Transcript_26600/g.87202 Transcript_26600/m.87202 type:complete len:185 (+) Transcript_26600:2-556(+)